MSKRKQTTEFLIEYALITAQELARSIATHGNPEYTERWQDANKSIQRALVRALRQFRATDKNIEVRLL